MIQNIIFVFGLLLLIHFILVNILEIPYTKNLVKSPKLTENNLTLAGDKVTDTINLDDISKKILASYAESSQYTVNAVNQDDDLAKPADFKDEKTNINQFYQANPDIFNTNGFNAYVPHVSSWNEEGNKMQDKLINAPTSSIEASNSNALYVLV